MYTGTNHVLQRVEIYIQSLVLIHEREHLFEHLRVFSASREDVKRMMIAFLYGIKYIISNFFKNQRRSDYYYYYLSVCKAVDSKANE